MDDMCENYDPYLPCLWVSRVDQFTVFAHFENLGSRYLLKGKTTRQKYLSLKISKKMRTFLCINASLVLKTKSDDFFLRKKESSKEVCTTEFKIHH